MNKTLYNIVIVILILAVIGLFGYAYSTEQQKNSLSNALSLADLSNQKFKTEVNAKGEEISSQQKVILSQKQALANNLITIEDLKEYKRVHSKIQVVTNTVIDTLFVPYDADSTYSVSVTLPTFNKPFNYTEKDDWFKLKGKATNSGIFFDTISIRNKYSLLIADKKMGFFKKAQPQVVLTNENPFTTTESMNNVDIEYIKPFYKRNWFWFVVGGTASYLIVK